MIDTPKHLNSPDDYLHAHAMAMAGAMDNAYMRARWQSLLDTASHYVFDRILAAGEQPPAPEPAFRVCEETNDAGTARTLFRLEADPNSTMSRLGFTSAEINNHLTELGV